MESYENKYDSVTVNRGNLFDFLRDDNVFESPRRHTPGRVSESSRKLETTISMLKTSNRISPPRSLKKFRNYQSRKVINSEASGLNAIDSLTREDFLKTTSSKFWKSEDSIKMRNSRRVVRLTEVDEDDYN